MGKDGASRQPRASQQRIDQYATQTPPPPRMWEIWRLGRRHLMVEARLCPVLRWENHRILVFPDYTREIQARRRSYEHVKQKLRSMQLTYMLLFPARLKVLMDERSFFFESPETAWGWLTEEGRVAWKGPLRSGRGSPALGPAAHAGKQEDAVTPGPVAGGGAAQVAQLN
ncbi:hypothetical protein NDU88_006810 [Pleurodeles waltl]|uniref:Uncharacterized protein n=1 Tax=Pleurodeles waltl TaxID=8319 RepID=A0AAV7VMY6_PLEWA|nr:hypothetical protein NDU88_006810 [Pleurodeles waltl]